VRRSRRIIVKGKIRTSEGFEMRNEKKLNKKNNGEEEEEERRTYTTPHRHHLTEESNLLLKSRCTKRHVPHLFD
jgi:hypothetical protein